MVDPIIIVFIISTPPLCKKFSNITPRSLLIKLRQISSWPAKLIALYPAQAHRESMAFMSNPLVCAPIECETMEEMAASMVKAKAEGANIVELCIDSFSLIHISEVESLIKLRTLPAILSFRFVLLN